MQFKNISSWVKILIGISGFILLIGIFVERNSSFLVLLTIVLLVIFLFRKKQLRIKKDGIKIQITTQENQSEFDKNFEIFIDNEKILILGDTLHIDTSVHWLNIIFRDKRYGYSPEINKWSYHRTGTPPEPFKSKVQEWIKTNIHKFYPEKLKEGEIKTVYRYQGKTRYSIKGEFITSDRRLNTIWAYLYPEVSMNAFSISFGEAQWSFNVMNNQFTPIYNLDTFSSEFLAETKVSDYLIDAVQYWLLSEYKIFQNKTSSGPS